MAKTTTPIAFVRQVRQETAKVTWPNRKETMVTTVLVLIMVAIASIFLFGVDTILAWIVKFILKTLGG
ncbi:MAG: preprotein translocase subunit SecE [Pseudomonadota bacterium]|nr:preprotein translocase subunit SecE [Pseudomonadota bacterium]